MGTKIRKFKPHKGLRKRVRITRNGKVVHAKVGGRHRKSLHTSKQNRQLRKSHLAAPVERRRAQTMLRFKIRRPSTAAPAKAVSSTEDDTSTES